MKEVREGALSEGRAPFLCVKGVNRLLRKGRIRRCCKAHTAVMGRDKAIIHPVYAVLLHDLGAL